MTKITFDTCIINGEFSRFNWFLAMQWPYIKIHDHASKVQQILLLSPNIPFTSPYSAIKIWFKIHIIYISSFHHSTKLQKKKFYWCMHGQAIAGQLYKQAVPDGLAR